LRAARRPPLAQSAGLELALLDPHWLRELRLVVSDLLDEALGVLAPEKDIDCVAERATCRERVVAST
jgi:hypothetical protein